MADLSRCDSSSRMKEKKNLMSCFGELALIFVVYETLLVKAPGNGGSQRAVLICTVFPSA